MMEFAVFLLFLGLFMGAAVAYGCARAARDYDDYDDYDEN